ncbi:Ig-like domain-containing protein, partial [Pseudomonas alvandae]|uniref:Ig-like domain-containing protein n=1 Tax=Pseudomonas canavaninivorans TaxID=2842348 RepID=UPI002B1E5338
MELNGLNVNADFLALTGTPAPGTTQTRVPTSGDGGYYYFSNATDVATVNGVGLVSGLKNGDATITVRENSTQREVSFPVKVRNVLR